MATLERGGQDLTRGKSSVIWAIYTILKPLKPPADKARMASDPKQTPSARLSPQDLWKEIVLTRSGIDELLKQGEETGDLRPVRAALDDLQLKTSNYEKLLEEMQAPLKGVLGRNFLGTDEWQQGFGVRVGAPPLIPECLTPELLNSQCPLHPGQLIKETHILMLVPKTVNGLPYTALRLGELCSSRKGSGYRLIFDEEDWARDWKEQGWANLPQAHSEWVLIPKSDPDPSKAPKDKHFRGKNIEQQREVHKHYAAEYREAKALEVMTMALLNDLVNGEPRILTGWNRLRCVEPNASGGRICVGDFDATGLKVFVALGVDRGAGRIGRALARKL
jgi:hypothetical protein